MPNNLFGGGVAGYGTIAINGITYDLAKDLKYSAIPLKRETLVNQSGVPRGSYKVMPKQCYISATLRDGGKIATGAFAQMGNVSVVATLANGKTVFGDGMWYVDDSEVETMEGEFQVKFEGPLVSEKTV